jgi:predicted nucleic acid-binding protein
MTELIYCKQQDSTLKNIYLKYYSLSDSIQIIQDSILYVNNKYSRSHQKAMKYEKTQEYLNKLDRLVVSDSILAKEIINAIKTGNDTLILNVLVRNINLKHEEIALLKKENEMLRVDLGRLGIKVKELETDTSNLKKLIITTNDQKDSAKKEYINAMKRLDQKEFEILLMKKLLVTEIIVKHKARKNETQICFNIEENTNADQSMKDVYIIIKGPNNLILYLKKTGLRKIMPV